MDCRETGEDVEEEEEEEDMVEEEDVVWALRAACMFLHVAERLEVTAEAERYRSTGVGTRRWSKS